MPYRRRYTRQPVRRTFRGGRKLNDRQKTQVKRLIGTRQETKFYSSTLVSAAVSSSATLYDVTNPGQGDTDQTRDGDRLYAKKLYVRMSLTVATGDVTNLVRIIWFQWFPSTTTLAPTVSDILLLGPSGAADVYSHYSHDRRQMFSILYDKVFTLSGSATIVTTSSQKRMTYILHPKRKQMQFDNGASTGTNHIWLMTISDSSAVSHPQIVSAQKFMFTDS